MADRLITLAAHPATRGLVRALGLPTPIELERTQQGYTARPFEGRLAMVGGDGPAASTARQVMEAAGAALRRAGPRRPGDDEPIDILVLDALAFAEPADLRAAYTFFNAALPQLARNGRIVVFGPPVGAASSPIRQAVVHGLEGFCRSLGKEVGRRGAVANLLRVDPDAIDRLEGPLRFFAGSQSAYVGGQVARITAEAKAPGADPKKRVLEGRVALVTGAARGIGAATAARLAREGALVVCLDVPQAAEALKATSAGVGAQMLALDVSQPAAALSLADELERRFGRVDVVVHNAGITRDRTLAKMTPEEWDQVLTVNLTAIAAIDEALVGRGLLSREGRLVYLSSISGIAGAVGQANYATTKAALIGYVRALAVSQAPRGVCVNAVAPGFIETAMTRKMPVLTREVGRRLNSLSQGGRPSDVAELIAFLASPGACGITGQTLRVCGQALIGA